MDDYNGFNGVYYMVRARARHPAAATLWALWMTTSESEAVWQPSDRQGKPYGQSQIDQEQASLIKNSGGKVQGFLDNDRAQDALKWLASPDAATWLASVAKAIRGE
jgi:hypothetical protein